MTTWASMYDWVLPELSGHQTQMVDLHLRSVSTDFMDYSEIYCYTLATITLVNGTATYTLAGAPAGYDIARIKSMAMGEGRLFPRSEDQLRMMFMNWQTAAGPPGYYLQETMNDVRLIPKPDQTFTDGISVRVVLVPTRAATGIEDWIYESWIEVIAAGVKAKLMEMPQKPWTNAVLAAKYANDYRIGRDKARHSAQRGMTRAPLRVSHRFV